MTQRTLQFFTVNKERDLLVPDIACYQLNLRRAAEAAIAEGKVDSETFSNMPSWKSFSANPYSCTGFFVRILQAICNSTGDHSELHVKKILAKQALRNRQSPTFGPRVAMMFINANNPQMLIIDEIANEAVDWKVLTLTGKSTYKGKKINNKQCERIAKEFIEEAQRHNKSVLIISNRLAQRSFSVPQITELYLAQDGGGAATTIQKMSRTLTPDNLEKIGRVFSLSFDPNLDDTFDGMVIESARNIRNRNKDEYSYVDAMLSVLDGIELHIVDDSGNVLDVDKSEYLKKIIARKSVGRVLGAATNLSGLPFSVLEAIAEGKSDYIRNEKQDVVETGPVREQETQLPYKKSKAASGIKTIEAQAKKVVTTVLEKLVLIRGGTGCDKLVDALDTIRKIKPLRVRIEEELGIEFAVLEYMFENNIISQEHADIMYELNVKTVK